MKTSATDLYCTRYCIKKIKVKKDTNAGLMVDSKCPMMCEELLLKYHVKGSWEY